MSKYSFKECVEIAKSIELQARKGISGYWIYESGTRFEKFFPSLDELSAWLLIRQKQFHKDQDAERKSKDSWANIWNKKFDERNIDLHFDTSTDKVKAKKK